MKETGECLTNVIDSCVVFFLFVFLSKNLQIPEPRLCFTQFLGAASRRQKTSIIHEDGLFLHTELLLDTHCDHFLLFLLPVSLLVTTIYLYIL